MAAAYIRDTGAQSGSDIDTDAASFASLPAAGNAIFVFATMYNAAGGFVAGDVTDNQGVGNVYAMYKGLTQPNASLGMHADLSVGATSGTFTLTINPLGSSGCWIEWIGVEFSDIDSGVTADKDADSVTSGSTPTVTTAATTYADELVLGILTTTSGGSAGIDPAAGYTTLYHHDTGADTVVHYSAFKIVSATGTQNFNGGTLGSSAGYAISVVTFKATTGGGGTATLEQTHYRWRNDDSGLVGPSY